MAASEAQPRTAARPDPMRHHKHYEPSKHGPSPYAGGSSFMERVSEAVASSMGTVGFLLVSSAMILAPVAVVVVTPAIMRRRPGATAPRSPRPPGTAGERYSVRA